MDDRRRLGTLWALGSALGIAGWAIPWKLASAEGAASANALLLLLFAAAFNSVYNRARPTESRPFTGFDWALAAALAAFTLVGNLASATAIQSLSPALLTLAQRGEIILVALMAWPLAGERPDRLFWLGAGLATAGLLVLQAPFDAADARAVGFAWAGLSVVAFSSMVVLTRVFIHRFDPARVNGLRLWLSVLLWFAWHGFPPALLEVTPAQAAYASLAAFFGPFAGRLAMMTSSRYLEARLTTLATLAAPPLTLVFGVILLSDTPTTREVLGGLAMLVGIAIPVLGHRSSGRRSAGGES
ncbi:MAG: DMT family transporter [Myxococcota bacterium]|nr:DMT family transporter [Myxococcota bacterium]